ncbi:MAG: DUF4832 domain-containing protein [Planctomycetaceae bacterium]
MLLRPPSILFMLILWASLLAVSRCQAGEPLEYVPAAIDNPLKGLVPYSGEKRNNFPHSMEFNSLPLGQLMTGMDEFNWQPLEELLNDVASRGHQTVLRIWMVYPGFDNGIPEFLIKDGLKVTTWLNEAMDPFPPAKVHTPDYNDPRLRRAMQSFVTAMGKKYDGDPRIGFLTAGLLGLWGEWHEYPRQDLFASKETQAEVLNAFTAAFRVTPILLRYPTGDDHWLYTKNAHRPFGYHDDSFAWATLDTGRDEDSWFFMPSMRVAGPSAMSKWKTHPIGGEIRPELWGSIFDDNVDHKQAQDFGQCVRETHASWLLDTGMMEKKQSRVRVKNASIAVQKMGYEFHVTQTSIKHEASRTNVKVQLRNTGVAPFYYDWKVVMAAFDSRQATLRQWPTDWKITGLLPGDADRTWLFTLENSQIPTGTDVLVFRVVNPLSNGLPLRFANAQHHQSPDGWFRIGEMPAE